MSSREIAKKLLKGDDMNMVDITHPLNVIYQLLDIIKNQNQFKVLVNKLTASNGITWIVTVDHPSRPKDAMPWDDGRMEVFHTSNEDYAIETKEAWDKFFNYKGSNDEL